MRHHHKGVVFACVLACVSGACVGRGDSDPEAVVEQFIAAANAGHGADVYALLGPESRKRLDELRQSAKRVSGRLALQPENFLSVGRAPSAWEPQGVRLLRKSETVATVQVYSAAGDRYAVHLVRQGRDWKVELPGS